jgi:hypothetical protein
MNTIQNLDFIAAEFAPMIIDVRDEKKKKNTENYLNQALGVLAEQGPFAVLLWAKAGSEQVHKNLIKHLPAMLKKIGLPDLEGQGGILKQFTEQISSDFVKLMMVRQLFDRVLIYARYYAKAEG